MKSTTHNEAHPAASQTRAVNRVVQRKCACGAKAGAGDQCTECATQRTNERPQAQLKFSQSGDVFEAEADRVANAVMSNHGSAHGDADSRTHSPLVQRHASSPESAPASNGTPTLIDQTIASRGQPLDATTRSFMQSRMGHDFGHVRIHTDSNAAESAAAINANAYTVGNHIAFGAGRFAPRSEPGLRLLAHELTHVVQQSHGAPRMIARDGPPQTPEEMWRNVLQKRGEDYAIPVGDQEATRQKLLDMSKQIQTTKDEKLKAEYNRLLNRYNVSVTSETGGKLGTGFSTYCMAQVVDKDGKVIATAFGEYDGKVHAESRAMSRLEGAIVGKDLRGARLEIVVDQKVCEHACQPAIRKFVEKHKLGGAMSWTFRAERLDGKGLKSPKGTASDVSKPAQAGRTAQRVPDYKFPADLDETPSASKTPGPGKTPAPGKTPDATKAPATEVPDEHEPTTPRRTAPQARNVPQVPGEEPQVKGGNRPRVPSAAGEIEVHPTPKTVAKGMALNLGSGVAVGIFQHQWRDKVQRDLAELPKPKIDKRTAREYLSEKDRLKGPRLIDLLNKNFKGLGQELDDDNTERMNVTLFEFLATPLITAEKAKDFEKRFERLDELNDSLREYETGLDTLEDNLDAVLDEEDNLLESQKQAKAALKVLEDPLFAKELIEHGGLSVEDWSAINSGLSWYISSIDMLLKDTKALKKKIGELRGKSEKMREQIDEAWKIELGSQFQQHIKEKRAEEAWLKKQKEQYIEMVPCDWLNADEKGIYYDLRTREGEGLFKLQEIEKKMKDPEWAGARDLLRAQYAEIRNIIDGIRKEKSQFECKQMRVPV